MVEAISPETLERVHDGDEDPLLIDVRAPADFERGHLPDSENVPLDAIAQQSDRIAADGDRIVTICAHGIASQQAARLLAAHEAIDDDQVFNLTGGIDAWEGPLEGSVVDAE